MGWEREEKCASAKGANWRKIISPEVRSEPEEG